MRRERGGQGQFGAHKQEDIHTHTLGYMLVLCSSAYNESVPAGKHTHTRAHRVDQVAELLHVTDFLFFALITSRL